MKAAPCLHQLRQKLHLSYSQVNTYLSCSLRYYFHYVKGLPAEHLSSALLLGTAIHGSLARYFQSRQQHGRPEAASLLLELFQDSLCHSLAAAAVPVRYQGEAADAEALVAQGKSLLQAFLADPGYPEMDVVAVELPLAAPLPGADGQPGDFLLVGAIDLLLRDSLGRLLAIDHKTAKAAMTQDAADAALQLSAYAYLLRATGHLGPQEPLRCGFQVLRKLKAPKLERLLSWRQPADSERFCRLAQAVLAGIEAQTFLPCPGWHCEGCAYQQACRQW